MSIDLGRSRFFGVGKTGGRCSSQSPDKTFQSSHTLVAQIQFRYKGRKRVIKKATSTFTKNGPSAEGLQKGSLGGVQVLFFRWLPKGYKCFVGRGGFLKTSGSEL